MFCTHIYFNGNCREAIEFYTNGLGAKVLVIIPCVENGKEQLITHSEIEIDNQKLMMNDFGDNEGNTIQNGYQLVIQFENEMKLRKAFDVLSKGGTILSPIQKADFSPCATRFNDKFGTRWAFYV